MYGTPRNKRQTGRTERHHSLPPPLPPPPLSLTPSLPLSLSATPLSVNTLYLLLCPPFYPLRSLQTRTPAASHCSGLLGGGSTLCCSTLEIHY